MENHWWIACCIGINLAILILVKESRRLIIKKRASLIYKKRAKDLFQTLEIDLCPKFAGKRLYGSEEGLVIESVQKEGKIKLRRKASWKLRGVAIFVNGLYR